MVVGAGIAGLTAAFELAHRGLPVVVVEAGSAPGGKMRRLEFGGRSFDAGPTVLTMRWVLDELFDGAGLSLDEHVPMRRAAVLARHAWSEGETLDLHADVAATADAIGRFAGAAEARGFLRFSAAAEQTWRVLEPSFIRDQRPNVASLAWRVGVRRPGDLLAIRPFETLWNALGRYFRDPRLRQLFARYATYCGSSPFRAPATLMLVAHAEQRGVWLVDDGLYRIAEALERIARSMGAEFRYGVRALEIGVGARGVRGVHLSDGSVQPAAAVIVNADVAAVAGGRLGSGLAPLARGADRAPRSLSAVTWLLAARTSGFPLLRHNVFFSRDYRAEFDALFDRGVVADDPTTYVCAQDRGCATSVEPRSSSAAERMLCLVNAPADGDRASPRCADREALERIVFTALARRGLHVEHLDVQRRITTPDEFAREYPGTGGALYGAATHGWRSSFRRPAAGGAIRGAYLAGGSAHPGPGVPMAVLSARLAVRRLLAER